MRPSAAVAARAGPALVCAASSASACAAGRRQQPLAAVARRMMSSDRHDRIASLGNVFSEFTLLSNEHGSENLGQGFPSFGAPDFLTKGVEDLWGGDLYTTELARHTLAHQYTTPGCEPELAAVRAGAVRD